MIIRGHFFRKYVINILLLVCITSIIFYGGCNKEEPLPRTHPKIRTLEVADISSEGARYSGRIEKQGNEEIIEWGFVWSDKTENLNLDNGDYYLEKYTTGSDVLTNDIRSTLVEKEAYYIKFFARTASRLVYGNIVTFESMGSRGPEISSFTPESGTLGTQVSIYGSGFRQQLNGNIVRFDTVRAEVISTSDTMIMAVVPPKIEAKKVKLSVQVEDKKFTSPAYFDVLGASTTSFYPKTGTVGDTITIEGQYLTVSGFETYVYFFTYQAQLLEQSENKLRVLVPDVKDSAKVFIGIRVGSHFTETPEKFSFTKPEINSIVPATAKAGDTLTIVGNNFSLIPEANKFMIDKVNCPVISSSKTNLKIIALDGDEIKPFPESQPPSSKVEVQVASTTSNIKDDFRFITPTITSFSPEKVTFLDDITFSGTGFNNIWDELKVKVDEINVDISPISDTQFCIHIPAGDLGSGVVSISTKYYKSSYTQLIAHPEIHSANPSVATFGDKVIIKGEFFNPDLAVNKVFLNDIPASIISVNLSEIQIEIPSSLKSTNGKINVTLSTGSSQSFSLTHPNRLSLLIPKITSVSPLSITQEENQIVLEGDGFNPDKNEMGLNIEGKMFDITSSDRNRIIASLPFERIPYDEISTILNGILTLTCGGFIIRSNESVTVTKLSVWTQKAHFPASPIRSATSFSIGSKGYILCGDNSYDAFVGQPTDEVWEFDPIANSWQQKADFPGGYRYRMFSAYNGINAFVGFGDGPSVSNNDKRIWRYDSSNDTWSELPEFPGVPRAYAIAFLINNNLFVGGGYIAEGASLIDFWKFDLQNNEWTQLDNIPYLLNNRGTFPFANTVIDGKGYSCIQSYSSNGSNDYLPYTCILSYDPMEDNWRKIPESPIQPSYTIPAYANFSLNSLWYFHSGYHMQAYDPFKQPSMYTVGGLQSYQFNAGTAFSIGDKGYICLGFSNNLIWEFDPSKLQ
jgi:hypothetical protein